MIPFFIFTQGNITFSGLFWILSMKTQFYGGCSKLIKNNYYQVQEILKTIYEFKTRNLLKFFEFKKTLVFVKNPHPVFMIFFKTKYKYLILIILFNIFNVNWTKRNSPKIISKKISLKIHQ
jgi:hypothetical protein